MRITVRQTLALTAGIADIRPVGVLAPLRPSLLLRAHALFPRRGSTGPALRRRPLIMPARSRVMAPTVESGDTVVVSVVRPPRHGAGGGPRARPATTLV